MKVYHPQLNSFRMASNKTPYFGPRQAGVTLLLAILVLATMLAISLSLAAILFVEIRTSGDLDRTEGALYAATGVGEQSLYYLKRDVCTDPGCASLATTTYLTYLNGVNINGAPQVTTTSSPVFYDIIPPGQNFKTAKIYYFCSDVATSSGCGFGKVVVNYVATEANITNNDILRADLCQFDPSASYGTSTPCSQLSYSGYWLSSDQGQTQVQLTPSSSSTSWSSLVPTQVQELILYETANIDPINVSISTYGPDTSTPLGLPLAGATSVNINAVNGTASRKIQVTVPAGSASSSP